MLNKSELWVETVIANVLRMTYDGTISEYNALSILQCTLPELDKLMQSRYGNNWEQSALLNYCEEHSKSS